MKLLPESDATLFVRTDFGDSDAWEAICAEIKHPPEEDMAAYAQFAAINSMIGQDVGETPEANLTIVDDPAFAGLAPDQLVARLPAGTETTFLFVVDHESVAKADHPILVLGLFDQKCRTFRAVPAQIQAIENNLSIANMAFADFADAVDDTGVFRGC